MPTTARTKFRFAITAAIMLSTGHANAQDAPAEPPAATPPPTAAPAQPEGLVPIPDYAGTWKDRPYLFGEFGGERAKLANKGLTFEVDWTQTAQGVVDGGKRRDWDYGGSLDYILVADLHRMGVMQGAIVKVRAESRYGETVNDDSAGLLPVNTDGFFPFASSINQGIPFTITELTYTQFLSETFGLAIGKFQTLDGDPNEFAGGRGRSQFMNANFVFNAVAARAIPYSSLGGALFWAPTKHVMFTSSFINTADSSTTSGFDHVEDGWNWSAEVDVQYRLGRLPGGFNVGGIYSFAGDFAQLGGRLIFTPGQGLSPSKEDDAWCVYTSAWQYLYAPDIKAGEDGKIDLANGKADHRGLGLFGRFGFADQDVNPVEWAASLGLGGRGLIPGREGDTFGVGYFYSEVQSLRVSSIIGLEDSTCGIEAFYNIALTPAAGLTFDIQWIDGGFSNIEPSTVVGLRLDLRF